MTKAPKLLDSYARYSIYCFCGREMGIVKAKQTENAGVEFSAWNTKIAEIP